MRAHLASLVEEFRRHAAEIAVVEHRGNRRYATTYSGLAELAGRFAAELERRGITAGERVVLWGENSAEWIGAFFGCLLRGVVVVPLDATGSTEFAERVVKDVGAKLIVGDRSLLYSLAVEVPQLLLSGMMAQMPAEPLFAVSDAVTSQSAFQIVFTSGTTSEPKGIVHTHRNVLTSLQPIENEIAKYRKYERWVHPLRFLHVLPLSHVFGQFMGLWVPPLLASEVHFGRQLDPVRMTELIREERISVLVAVPRVLQLLRVHLLGRFAHLADELEQAKGLSIWKRWWRFRQVHRALGWKFWAAISGGASLPAELEGFWSGLGFALIQGYGMTETAALVTLNHPFHIGRGTIGKALPGREVRISDEGEILVRGDMLAAATWQNGAMSLRVGEWLATGDLAAQDASGELRFLGRRGDVIVTSAGLNVHPADLEEAMTKQPGVRGCVVVPCELAGGAEPVAVVLFSGGEQELQAAVSQANQGLAEYQKIRRVLKWQEPQFPYTSTGKLLRRRMGQWACSMLARQQSGASADTREGDMLLKMIAEVTGEHLSNGPDHLRLSEDLHLDSLGRVQLQSALEPRLGLELEDDAIATVQTLGELRAVIEKGAASELPLQASSSAAYGPPAAPSPAKATEVLPRSQMETAVSEHWYPRWPWTWPIQAIRVVFVEVVMRPLVWLLAAPRVVRPTGGLPQGPVLVIANHVTAYDGALILYALPGRLRRRVAIAMSGEMLLSFRRGRGQRSALRNLLAPVAYWLVTALFNVFPLPRLRGFRRSFAHAGEAMDRGYSVLIFPEGTRSQDGKLHPFRPGIGLLAEESRVPVVPVALIGLGALRTEKAQWFRSGRLEVRIGEATPVVEETGPTELTVKLEESVRRLQSEA
ncbi:AMP-binding protein [Granulicella sp. WH15]|uniref:AMP-binding protein n=1 Tax=Granulicella sp. WH15 TaxID=2602070 RepID=UPI0013678561|nr:AMP-binding protein [Granulicella sp. WH15]QHN03039.1 AMP-binding protein [Granulicella sp. WH15]